MKTRFLPVLTFVLDQGIKKSLEISKLIQEALSNPSKLSDSDQIKEEEESDDVEQEDSDGDPSEVIKEE
jgi:ribosome-binding factor A